MPDISSSMPCKLYVVHSLRFCFPQKDDVFQFGLLVREIVCEQTEFVIDFCLNNAPIGSKNILLNFFSHKDVQVAVLIKQISKFGFHTFQRCSKSTPESVSQENPPTIGASAGAKEDPKDDVFQFGLLVREIVTQSGMIYSDYFCHIRSPFSLVCQ